MKQKYSDHYSQNINIYVPESCVLIYTNDTRVTKIIEYLN